jgi:hypothetical protein
LGDITSELTERVLTPARAEAEKVLREAGEKAERIIAEAEKDSLITRNRAKEEAERVLKQMDIDMRTAARNFILLLQERLEEAIAHPVVAEEVGAALGDREFLKKTIEIVLREFGKFGGAENTIEILLPEKEREELGGWFVEKFRQKALRNISIHFTDKVTFGFKIGHEDSGYHFNFGDGLVEAFKEFCSPRFRKYFFVDQES